MRKAFAGKVILVSALFLLFAAACGTAEEKKKDPILEEAKAAMERVCRSMQPYLIRPWRYNSVKIEASPEVNAYVDRKGNIVFFMGIINLFQSEDEAALVCGHEMAHASGGHIKRSIGRRILGGVVAGAIGGLGGDLAGTYIVSGQSRSHEREADENGLLYMWSAGYDPRVSWRLWEAMSDMSGDVPFIAKYLGSHPVPPERINNLKVLTYRYCHDGRKEKYCNEIIEDQELKQAFENFD